MWAGAGEVYTPAGFATDGFVHLSFAHQVARVANALYRDEPDLIVVEIDPAAFEVVVEDCYESGEEFPHIYRPLPTATAVGMHELNRDGSCDWTFTAGAATDPSSPDR